MPAKPGRSTGRTGSWSREVGVHRVTWQNGNGLGASCLLASSTASSLCRTGAIWERFIESKACSASVENIRTGDAMDVGSELSESSSVSEWAKCA